MACVFIATALGYDRCTLGRLSLTKGATNHGNQLPQSVITQNCENQCLVCTVLSCANIGDSPLIPGTIVKNYWDIGDKL